MVKADEWHEKIEKELETAKEKGQVPDSFIELVSELRIHQAELEMQNEELKQSQEELSELYNQYHELYDEAPVGYFTLDKEGIIRNVNVKGAELLQLDKLKIIGRGFSRFIHKDYESSYFQSIADALDAGENQKLELPLKRNNSLFHVHMEVMPLYKMKDESYRIIITDITKSKKSEDVLDNNEQRYCEIVETAKEGIAIHEPDGTITYVNQRMADMLGYSPEEIIGRSSLDFVDDEEKERMIRARKSLKEQGSFSKERKMGRKDGSILWTLSNVSPRRDGADNFIGYLAMHNDITERKKAEEALHESEELFRSIFNNSLDALYRRNLITGRYDYVSPAIEQITGFSVREVLTMDQDGILERVHPDDLSKVLSEKMEVSSEVTQGTVDYRFLCKDNTYKWVSDQFKIIYDKEGKPIIREGNICDITERKKAEQMLHESEELYRGVVENTTAVILRVNPQGIIQFANECALNFFGYLEDELIGKHAVGTIVPEMDNIGRDLAKMVDEIAENPDSFHSNENENMLKNGERVWMEWTNSGVYDKEGNLKEFLSVGIDATERKKAEEELKQARDNLQRELEDINALHQLSTKFIEGDDLNSILQEVLTAAISIIKSDKGTMQLLDSSTGTLKIVGSKNFSPPFLKFFESVYPGESAVCGTALLRLERVIVEDITKSPIFKGSDSLNVLLNEDVRAVQSTPIVSKDGNLLGIISTHFTEVHVPTERELRFIDIFAKQAAEIIQRKQVEESLKKAYDTLELKVEERTRELKLANLYNRSLIEASLDPLVTIGPDGKITDVNWATELVTGYYRDKLIGTDFSDCFTEPEKAKEGYRHVFQEGHVIDYPLEIKHKDGHNTPVLYNASVYKDESGEVIGVFAAARDITELKKAEKQLKHLIEELKRSNKELQSFAYITSHDLQEPLRTIASFTQLLEMRYKGRLDSDADEFMDYIVSASVRMKDMIQGLLEYSRVDTHNEPFKEFESEEAVNHALIHLHSSIGECNGEVTTRNLPLIFGDEHLIIRVFQNLVGNALKFRKEEVQPEIHISARKENGEYVFSVADNGIGMEKQYSKKIFEPFKRLHTMDAYEGTGIGLAVVKRIIEHHGGHIWFESEFGVGSTFYFAIPVEQVKNGGGHFPKIWQS